MQLPVRPALTLMCVWLVVSRIWYSIPSSYPVTSYHIRSIGLMALMSLAPSFLHVAKMHVPKTTGFKHPAGPHLQKEMGFV